MMKALRAIGAVILGTFVTTVLILVLVSAAQPILFGSAHPNTWLIVATMLTACSIPYFAGSIVAGYLGRRNGWKLGAVVCVPSAVYFLFAFLPVPVADTVLDIVLTYAMAYGLALVLSIFGGMFGQRVFTRRHPVVPLEVGTKPVDASTPEP